MSEKRTLRRKAIKEWTMETEKDTIQRIAFMDGFDACYKSLAALARDDKAVEDIVGCYDCHLPYSDDLGWADFVVSDKVWLMISPTGHEGGLLCATCMFRRMRAVGIRAAEGAFTSGPCADHGWKKPGDLKTVVAEVFAKLKIESCELCLHPKPDHFETDGTPKHCCDGCNGFTSKLTTTESRVVQLEAALRVAREFIASKDAKTYPGTAKKILARIDAILNPDPARMEDTQDG